MNGISAIFRREFFGYFRTPVAYVFMAAFILAAVGLPWFVGRFFDANQASLQVFFTFLPWVYLFLIPAVGMRLWAEEMRSGTWEILFTSPISPSEAVIGKFLAAWAFIGINLALTLTVPATVFFLGSPDLGPMFSGYLGAILTASAFLSICSLASSLTRNQVIAFVVSVIICLVLVLLGFGPFNSLLENLEVPAEFVGLISSLSVTYHFDLMSSGLISLGSLCFFGAVTFLCLSLNILILER
ncbi:MAG: ABC transporter permease subunit [Verrucomicrobiota bacterium]